MIDGHCARTLHAEVNAILQGAEREFQRFYCLCDPFSMSQLFQTIFQVGCKRVVYINEYRMMTMHGIYIMKKRLFIYR